METGSKQSEAVRGSVITTVANNTSAWLQPTARSLVQGSLVWSHHYAIKKIKKAMSSSLQYSVGPDEWIWWLVVVLVGSCPNVE